MSTAEANQPNALEAFRERWIQSETAEQYAARRKQLQAAQPHLFDSHKGQESLGVGRWITIGSEKAADGEHHGGHHVFVGEDGKMKTGAFAGQTMQEAFGSHAKPPIDAPHAANNPSEAKEQSPGSDLAALDADRKQKQQRFDAVMDELQPLNERALQLEQAIREAGERKSNAKNDAEWNLHNRDYQKLVRMQEALNQKRRPLLDSVDRLRTEAIEAHRTHAKASEGDSQLKPSTETVAQPKALHEVQGESGMVARVFENPKGFSVSMTDADSGETVPSIKIFPTLDQAKAHAETIKPPTTFRQPSDETPTTSSTVAAGSTPDPWLSSPSQTKPNEEANGGDQLGLFGEAFKKPTASKPFKPTLLDSKAKQQGLFDTHGNANQMDFFGDAAMPDDLVYKPETQPEQKGFNAEEIVKAARANGKNIWQQSKEMGFGGLADLTPEQRKAIGEAVINNPSEETQPKPPSPARAAAMEKAKNRGVLEPATTDLLQEGNKPTVTDSVQGDFDTKPESSPARGPEHPDGTPIPLRERKMVAQQLAEGGMSHGDMVDYLSKRMIAAVDARKLASDALGDIAQSEPKADPVPPADDQGNKEQEQPKALDSLESKPESTPNESPEDHREDSSPTATASKAFESSISKGSTPREAARAAQKELDADYEYARASTVRNAGEDLKGSARHKVNAWKSLEDAEKNGTAATLVTRDQLLKNEPHDLMVHASKNPVTALAMHFAMRSFPPKPGTTKRGDHVKDREQYLEAYRKVKDKAESLAKEHENPIKAMGELQSYVKGLIADLRGAKRSNSYLDSIGMATSDATDKYNQTANDLVGLHNALSTGYGAAKNGPASRLVEFMKSANDKYGNGWANEGDLLESVAGHAQDIMEGKSMNATFGKESNQIKRFNPADAYVKHAKRTGGRDLSKIVSDPNKATKHLVDSFGVRGVQWGNTVSDEERKHHAARTVEALTDLADVVGLHPKDIALDGKLGLAIGARGKGNASAHYEPGTQVINLTRASGVGALAHEWGHAFDHMLNEFGTSRKDIDSARSSGDYMSGDHQYTHHLISADGKTKWNATGEEKGIRPGWSLVERPKVAIRNAYKQWWKKAATYRKRLETVLKDEVKAGTMSRKKAHEYWNSPEEIFARTFERHVAHKLNEDDRENTYLSGLGGDHPLWPTKAEAKEMAEAFDGIFSAYRAHKYGSTDRINYSRKASREILAELLFEPTLLSERYAGPDQMRFHFEWDESKHPRHPKGDKDGAGGEFRKKDDGVGPVPSAIHRYPEKIPHPDAPEKEVDRPPIYLTGSSNKDTRELAKEMQNLGVLITPDTKQYVSHLDDYAFFGVDNGCYGGAGNFNEAAFYKLLSDIKATGKHDRALFAAAPDVFDPETGRGDWEATLERSLPHLERIRNAGFPAAIVLQDGATSDTVPWEKIDAIFVGGSTNFKLGGMPEDRNKTNPEFVEIVREAKKRKIPIHYGRVNSDKRIEVTHFGLNATSMDGTYIAFGPDKNLERLKSWLKPWGKFPEEKAESNERPSNARERSGPKLVDQPRAKAGGEVSDVDGKFYRGGALMPVHGMYSGQEKSAEKGKGKGDHPVASEDGKGGGPKKVWERSPEDEASRKARHEKWEKWQKIKQSPLGHALNLKDNPHHIKWFHGTLDHWFDEAEHRGEDWMKVLAEEAKSIALNAVEDVEHRKWLEASTEEQAQSTTFLNRSQKKLLAKYPQVMRAREWLQEAQRQSADDNQIDFLLTLIEKADSSSPLPDHSKSSKPSGKWTKLKSGEWGVKIAGEIKAGDTVVVTSSSGKRSEKRIKSIESSADGSHIAEVYSFWPVALEQNSEPAYGEFEAVNSATEPLKVNFKGTFIDATTVKRFYPRWWNEKVTEEEKTKYAMSDIVLSLPVERYEWVESNHPRMPAGSPKGGEFTHKGMGGDSASAAGSSGMGSDSSGTGQHRTALDSPTSGGQIISGDPQAEATPKSTIQRELVERPDVQKHHSLHYSNIKDWQWVPLNDCKRAMLGHLLEGERKARAAMGGSVSEEDIWNHIDKKHLQHTLDYMNNMNHKSIAEGGKRFDDICNYNGVIPKLIAERLGGGERFFDPRALRGRWHEEAPEQPAQTQRSEPVSSEPAGSVESEPAPSEPNQPDQPEAPEERKAIPRISEDQFRKAFTPKPPAGVSKAKMQKVEKAIRSMISDNDEVVAAFRPIVVEAWQQLKREADDHNSAIREMTSATARTLGETIDAAGHTTGAKTMQSLSAMVRKARNGDLDPSKKRGFDELVDKFERNYPHMLQGRGEDGLLDILAQGIKPVPDILDEEVAERAITLAGPGFFESLDQGEEQYEPSFDTSDFEQTPFSWLGDAAQIAVMRYQHQSPKEPRVDPIDNDSSTIIRNANRGTIYEPVLLN